jgi:hypothetical protein
MVSGHTCCSAEAVSVWWQLQHNTVWIAKAAPLLESGAKPRRCLAFTGLPCWCSGPGHLVTIGHARRAVIEEDVKTGSDVARQSVGMATQVQPVAAILEELVGPAVGALAGKIT